jgi:hypothetical protein
MTNYCGTNGIKLPKLSRLLLVKSKADLGQHVRLLFKRKNGRLEATATPVMYQLNRAGFRKVEIAKIFDVSPTTVTKRLSIF